MTNPLRSLDAVRRSRVLRTGGRIVLRILLTLGLVLVFVAGVVTAVLLHLDAPATRRAVVTQVNAILAGALAGEVKLARLDHLGLDGVRGVSATVRDPDGVGVLRVDGVDVHVLGVAAARSALFGEGPIAIDVPSVAIADVDANLDGDGKELRIARSFAAKSPSPEDPNAPPGRGVLVEVRSVRLAHAWAHGTPPGAIAIDAEVSQLAAWAHVDPDVVRAELERVTLLARGLPEKADPRGELHATLDLPLARVEAMALEASFAGEALAMPASAHATMKDQHLDARLRVERERALLDAKAAIDLAGATRIVADVKAREIDLAAFVPDAPPSSLGLDAQGDVTIAGSAIHGTAKVDTLPGRLQDQDVPAVAVRAKFEGEAAHATAKIEDLRFPTEVVVDMTPRPGIEDGRKIVAAVRSKVPSLKSVPVVGQSVAGAASVDAAATLLLPEQSFDAMAAVEGVGLQAPEVGVGLLRVKARATGTPAHPVVDAEAHVTSVRTNPLPLGSVDARAKVEIVAPPGGVTEILVRDVGVEAQRMKAERIAVSARLVALAGDRLRVEGATVHGLGEPIRAEVTRDGRVLRGKVDAPKIDLPLVARLLGQTENAPSSGTLAIAAEGGLDGDEVRAELHAKLRDLARGQVRGGHAEIDAVVDRRRAHLDLVADIGEAGKVEIHAQDVVLAGPAAKPIAWKRAHGRVGVVGEVDLERALSMLPHGKVPISEAHGVISLYGRVGRDGPDTPPEVQLHAHTVGLVVAGKTAHEPAMGRVQVEPVAPWRSRGTELGVDVRNDATSGLTNVAFRATDQAGVLVATDAKMIVPYAAILADPSSAKQRVMAAPLSVRVVVPPRRLDQLPSIVGITDLKGVAEADVEMTGTVLDPKLRVSAHGRGVRTRVMPAGLKLDGDVGLEYDGAVADLGVKVSAEGREMVALSSRLEAKARDALRGVTPLPWNASTKVKLAAFPLESIPQLADRRVRGRITGEASLEGLHKDALAQVRLALEDLAVGRARYTKGSITADAGRGNLTAKVRLDQTDGFLDASARTGLTWGAALAPAPDGKAPVEASLKAKSFQAAAIQPFVQAAVPSLEGRIDADARAKIVPGKPGAELSGVVTFKDGTVQVAALGDELRRVRATVKLSPDGTIRVEDVAAAGTEGELNATAYAKLDGMRLADATADISIPEKKAFSVSVQGSPIGTVSGSIKVKARQSADAKTTAISIEVPKLAVELPQVTKTGVQQLEEKENIRVGVYRGRDRFLKLPLDAEDLVPPEQKEQEDAARTFVDVRLGRIEVARGNQARVALTGETKVSVATETKITGQIRALEGWADVQGKKFEVEKATVTFNGEAPPNPVVVATAGWTAADGTKVYADFVGPVKTGKVVLRSEPSRPKNEILALVLFGTADGANPTPKSGAQSSDGTTKAAVGLGGGFAAQGLTEALDDLAGIQATARIDTTRTNNPRPEVEFQVSPKVSVGYAHVIGTPPITEPDKNLAKTKYRFHRNWSLETTFGDRGRAVVDAIWQKRY